MPSTNSQRPWPTGGLTFAPARIDPEQYDVVYDNVTPARRDWLPDVLQELLPWMIQGVREVAARHDPKLLQTPRTGLVPLYLNEYGVEAVDGWYAYAASELAALVGDRPPEEWPTDDSKGISRALDTLLNVSTGYDEGFSSLDDIGTGPAQLINIAPNTPQVLLKLDEEVWRETRRAQRKRGLKAIALLSKGCDIELLTSPHLQQFLYKRHPDWYDQYLTESANSPGGEDMGVISVHDDVNQDEVLEKLGELTPGGGRLRLLAAIPDSVGEYRELRDLKADSRLNLSPGTIDRYYRDLEGKYEFLQVDDRRKYNSVTLTPSGRYAQGLLTDDYRVHHPHQAQLDDHLTNPPQPHTSIVLRAGPLHPAEEGQSYEDSIGSRSRSSQGSRPRELSPDECWLDEQMLVDRFTAGNHAQGVTLVNDRIAEFPDGRETYIGCSGDEVHVLVQWGGPIPTLARLGTTLLGTHAFDTILTPSRVDPLLSGPTSLDTLRLGRQLGWLSDSERDYANLRVRYERVGDSLLRLLRFRDRDPDTWAWVCAEAHGLLASATHLYDAAGLDVTIHVRIPDTDQLTRNDARYEQFIEFLQNAVPKSAAYRGNSASRMLLEKDGDKLRYRLPVDIDDTDRDAELTADWVVTGPGVTDFEDDIVHTFESISVREQVASGVEKGIRIPVEVASANTYAGVRETVERMLERLDRSLADALTTAAVTRLYLHAFGNVSHKSLTCSPFDIAEAILAADQLAPAGEPLTQSTLVRGLGATSSKKLYPWLSPAAREFMRALFSVDFPISRSEILEIADISESSYERHRRRLDEANLLTEPENHQYEACVPGKWPNKKPSMPVSNCNSDVQELVLYQTLIDAQVCAHQLKHLMNPVSTTSIVIGGMTQ